MCNLVSCVTIGVFLTCVYIMESESSKYFLKTTHEYGLDYSKKKILIKVKFVIQIGIQLSL